MVHVIFLSPRLDIKEEDFLEAWDAFSNVKVLNIPKNSKTALMNSWYYWSVECIPDPKRPLVKRPLVKKPFMNGGEAGDHSWLHDLPKWKEALSFSEGWRQATSYTSLLYTHGMILLYKHSLILLYKVEQNEYALLKFDFALPKFSLRNPINYALWGSDSAQWQSDYA